jgi:glycosyltransferase involved in cell wall biosynthesis
MKDLVFSILRVMKSVFFLFSHPAPYKVNLFNGLSHHLDLTVFFERKLGKYQRLQYLDADRYQFKHRFLKGIPIGKENHLSNEVIRHLKTHTYDFVVMNGYSSLTEIITILYLQHHNIPYYIYVNGGLIRKESFLKFQLKKRLISKAIGYFSPTKLIDDYLLYYGATIDKINHFPYSTVFDQEVISQPLTLQEKQSLRKIVGLPLEGNVFMAIGEFIPRKNFSALIQAWRRVPTSMHLMLIGEGKETSRYRRMIKRYQLKNIHLTSFQPKNLILSYLRASDGFILMSKEDIYGHVVNEALSQGIPVLASDKVIAAKVLIQAGVNGYLLPLSNMDRLPKLLHQLLLIQPSAASQRIARSQTIEAMVQAHVDYFLGKNHE